MPFIKTPLDILAECASIDASVDTETILKESEVLSGYEAYEEASNVVVYEAEMVPVIKVGNDYLTEMNFLAPYMKTNGIKSVVAALEAVALANGLGKNDVGLLVESEQSVTDTIKEACKKGKKAADATTAKVSKAEKLLDKVKASGKKVKKKLSPKKEECDDPDCPEGGDCSSKK